jgi:putative nucleotidyltransferase with HDIG domain
MIYLPPASSGADKLSLRAKVACAARAGDQNMLRRARVEAVRALLISLGESSGETRGHVLRVGRLMRTMSSCMGLSAGVSHALYFGALLHDIGKQYVRAEVLHKPAQLTEEEWVEMRLHPGVGAVIADQRGFPRETCEVILHHHERFDGKGYPHNLAGERIPLGARIFAVIDTYDAITSNRCYRAARPKRDAAAELEAHAGTQFDPALVQTFLTKCLPKGQ